MKKKIGTRGSKLALWQANFVKECLEKNYDKIEIEIVIIKTEGDKKLDVPLSEIGGKGLFIKEIEEALISKKVDLAVHSLKDMTTQIPEELVLGAVTKRE
ncbi:hydroxymethylbilane synthase, partial [bacterium]|nr:hydroxymethylbilane synthase [bacterium]